MIFAMSLTLHTSAIMNEIPYTRFRCSWKRRVVASSTSRSWKMRNVCPCDLFSVMLATCNLHALLYVVYQSESIDIHVKTQSIVKTRRVNAIINTKVCLFGFCLSKISEKNMSFTKTRHQFFPKTDFDRWNCHVIIPPLPRHRCDTPYFTAVMKKHDDQSTYRCLRSVQPLDNDLNTSIINTYLIKHVNVIQIKWECRYRAPATPEKCRHIHSSKSRPDLTTMVQSPVSYRPELQRIHHRI